MTQGLKEFYAGPYLLKPIETEEGLQWQFSYGGEIIAQKPIKSRSRRTIPKAFTVEADLYRESLKERFDAPLATLENLYGEKLLEVRLLPKAKWFLDGAKQTEQEQSNFIISFRDAEYLITLETLLDLYKQYLAPQRYWISQVLPASSLTTEIERWEPPSSWAIRHLMGEESFVGKKITEIADLVGVSARNFRAYSAAEGTRNRYDIPFATWHLLLQRLEIINNNMS